MPGLGAGIHRAAKVIAGWSGCQPTAAAAALLNQGLLVSASMGPHPWPLASGLWPARSLAGLTAGVSAPLDAVFALGSARCGVKIQIEVSAQLEANGDVPEMSRGQVYRIAEVIDHQVQAIIWSNGAAVWPWQGHLFISFCV